MVTNGEDPNVCLSMESTSVSVCEAVSSVLHTLEEQRKLAYSRSSIQLVSEIENKYPLSDVIMRRLANYFVIWLAVDNCGLFTLP